jgi:hypothetical protein
VHQLTTTSGITIAIVKRQPDWQHLIQTRQYHIPVRYVTRIIHSPWVAFYIPGWHTTHPHCIRHVASMSAMTIAPRCAYLPEEHTHPRAHQLYAILTFDVIYTLRMPISSAHWRRISVHNTTWGALTRTYDLGSLNRITQQTKKHTTTDVDNTELFDVFEPYEKEEQDVHTITQ